MRRIKRGDTVIEVIFAITIFCLVAIISITLMNSGINTAQGSLELTMARNEIDAQAEALRFIQNSFLAERGLSSEQQQYARLWRRITRDRDDCDYLYSCGLAINPEQLASFDIETCAEAYDKQNNHDNSIFGNNAFVINTRFLQAYDQDFDSSLFDDVFGNNFTGTRDYNSLMDHIIVSTRDTDRRQHEVFAPASLYPRLVFSRNGYGNNDETSDQLVEDEGNHLYRVVAHAEGIWVIAVRGASSDSGEPEFFDFYIRTCWYEPGNDYPSAIGTIVRLYNPEVAR